MSFLESLLPSINQNPPRAIVNDHWSQAPPMMPGVEFYCIPGLAAQYGKIFKNWQPAPDLITTHAANVMVNRFAMNRWAALKFAECLAVDFDYTYSGVHRDVDLSRYLHTLTPEHLGGGFNDDHRFHCLSPCALPTKWIYKDSQHIQTNQPGQSTAVINYGGNQWTWFNGLNRLFSCSAISLITESACDLPGVVFTEKTIYAIMGMTMPIWVGAVGAAHQWKLHGFDIFEDVIDHSYQWEQDDMRRYWMALYLNQDILSSLDHAREKRISMHERLAANLCLLQQGQLEKVIKHQIDSWPHDISCLVRPVFRQGFEIDI